MNILCNDDMPGQVAFLMLRNSIALKANFLCRVAPPSICEPAMKKFELRIYDFLETKFGVEKLSILNKKQIAMPQRHGGWGMRATADLNKILFVASFIGALPHLSGMVEK